MTQTTPVNAWPYPEGTDAPNGAAQMQALALAVEATMTAVKAYWAPTKVQKAAPESVTSSVVIQADDHLTLTIPANRDYHVVMRLSATGAAAGDLRTAWATTGTATFATARSCIGLGTGSTDATNSGAQRATVSGFATEVTYGTDGSNSSAIMEEFVVSGGVSGGTITLQWAQGTSSVTATTLSTNSWLMMRPLT